MTRRGPLTLQDLRVRLVRALEMTGTTSRDVWKPYWAAQQRFFKLLCISMKVPPAAAACGMQTYQCRTGW